MTRPAPSAATLARLAHRFRHTPAYANWRARIAKASPAKDAAPAPVVPAAKGKLVNTGIPACGSFYS